MQRSSLARVGVTSTVAVVLCQVSPSPVFSRVTSRFPSPQWKRHLCFERMLLQLVRGDNCEHFRNPADSQYVFTGFMGVHFCEDSREKFRYRRLAGTARVTFRSPCRIIRHGRGQYGAVTRLRYLVTSYQACTGMPKSSPRGFSSGH